MFLSLFYYQTSFIEKEGNFGVKKIVLRIA